MVRDAGPADAASVVEVHRAAWLAVHGALPASMSSAHLQDTWTHVLSGYGPLNTLVYEKMKHVLGFATFSLTTLKDEWNEHLSAASPNPETSELVALYVLPAYWRQGVGSGLLSAVLDRLVAASRYDIELWVIADRSSAVSFYSQHNFRLTPLWGVHRESAVCVRRMRRRLLPRLDC